MFTSNDCLSLNDSFSFFHIIGWRGVFVEAAAARPAHKLKNASSWSLAGSIPTDICRWHNGLRSVFEYWSGPANAKLVRVETFSGASAMARIVKNAILESVPVLVLLGLLAGAVGGLGIGLIQLT
jgi:hypothetical protein